jgi:ABC-2 type transport system ATP-binding protein
MSTAARSPAPSAAAPPAIEAIALTKRYGVHAAVSDVSFVVRPGEIVGFLGPNGAGKSTTLRMLAGFLGPTSGRARIAGFDVFDDADRARAATGYMPESVPLYGEMRVREYLRFRAELKGVSRAKRVAAVGDAMARAHVTDVADTLIDHLSKGYRQRVGLADAVVAKPAVLVLDEPTAGMDPNQIREVRQLIRELGGDHTVLLSTHILSEVEASCGRIIVIDRGQVVAEGTPGELSALRRAPRFFVTFRASDDAWKGLLAPSTRRIAEEPLAAGLVRAEYAVDDVDALGAAIEAQVALLASHGLGVREVSAAKASLEEVFAAITHGETLADEQATT